MAISFTEDQLYPLALKVFSKIEGTLSEAGMTALATC